ncbi:MAG TPA: hypothetical protein VFV85_01840 [Conexibacter sp.]|nr:hypothetical protein [Conexibacter sp.]
MGTADAAWLAALPCALLTALAVALLGPPLGHALLGPGSDVLFRMTNPRPEPAEHGRYLLALLGPAALAAAVLASARWAPRAGALAAGRWALAAQLALVAFVVVCFAAQNDVGLSAYRPLWERTRYFTPATLLLSLALALAGPWLLDRGGGAVRLAALLRETRSRRALALGIALALTAAWLLSAVETDAAIANRLYAVVSNLPASADEPFAILDGRTPLVDFHAQYGQLWPYVVAAAMALLGGSLTVLTSTMALGSGLALLAVYAVLRRIARSSLAALALYLPFLATGFFTMLGPPGNRYGPANLFGLWPTRYGGAYLLAWLLARHVDRAAPRRAWPLFLAGGLVAVDNPEFGVAALAALVAGLLAVRPPRSRGAAVRLLAEAAGGLLGAVALVALLTLVRAGALPRFGQALEFSRLYGIDGWALLPLPRAGIYLVVYVTFAAAIAVAAVRVAQGGREAVLTATLAWSGVFGLIASGYFVGRSHPQVLIGMFSAWALSLVLLTVAVVRALAARERARPSPAELLVLFGFGLLVCSLAQTPTPWSQLRRLTDDAPLAVLEQPEAQLLVRRTTRPHEPVVILSPLGHRVARETGRDDVSPYAGGESIADAQQLDRTVAALRRAGGDKVFVASRLTWPETLAALRRDGFAPHLQIAERYAGGQLVELVDGG